MNKVSSNSFIKVVAFFTVCMLAGIFIATSIVHCSSDQGDSNIDFDNAVVVDEYSDMTTAGVSVADSMIFEYLASLATEVDLPEEEPMTGDSVCAYVSHDTVYIQYYHGYEHQAEMFKFIYNQ